MKWRTLTDFPNYDVSENGDIRNNKTLLLLKHKIDRYGYPVVSLRSKGNRKYPTIHRLVAKAFVDNPNNYTQVNHIDGNKTNNHYTNLEWITVSGNITHALEHDLSFNSNHVELFNIETKECLKFVSIKKLSKYLNVYPNILLPYIKHSEKYPFMGKYIIRLLNISKLNNMSNSKIFGRTIYVYDIITDKWSEYKGISGILYETGIRCYKYNKTTDLSYIGYVVSDKIIPNIQTKYIKRNKKVLLENMINYLKEPYKPASKVIMIYDYYNKKEYVFNNRLKVLDFLNKNDPVNVVITKGILNNKLCKSSTNGKTSLIKGFGIKNGSNELPWYPWSEEAILSSRHGLPAITRCYKYNNKIVIGFSNLIKEAAADYKSAKRLNKPV